MQRWDPSTPKPQVRFRIPACDTVPADFPSKPCYICPGMIRPGAACVVLDTTPAYLAHDTCMDEIELTWVFDPQTGNHNLTDAAGTPLAHLSWHTYSASGEWPPAWRGTWAATGEVIGRYTRATTGKEEVEKAVREALAP